MHRIPAPIDSRQCVHPIAYCILQHWRLSTGAERYFLPLIRHSMPQYIQTGYQNDRLASLHLMITSFFTWRKLKKNLVFSLSSWLATLVLYLNKCYSRYGRQTRGFAPLKTNRACLSQPHGVKLVWITLNYISPLANNHVIIVIQS